jgi:hypothetical protein
MPEEGIFSAKSTTSGSIPKFGFTVTVPDNRNSVEAGTSKFMLR